MSTPRPTPRAGTKRTPERRTTGAVRALPSGRFQARYTAPDGSRRPLGTFDTRKAAERALAAVTTDQARGVWIDPDAGSETLADYAARYLARRTELAPRTRELYARQVRCWINVPVALPGPVPRTLVLGEVPLAALSVTLIADWHAGVVATSAARVTSRTPAARAARPVTDAQAARAWAIAAGLTTCRDGLGHVVCEHDDPTTCGATPVARSGRLSPAVLDAWHDAGAPRPGRGARPGEAPRDAGRTAGAQAYATVRLILNGAKREGLIVANPADVPGAGTVHPAERAPATPDQVADVAAAMPERYAAAVMVAAWGALRGGEVFALERQHVRITRDDAGAVTGAVVRITQALEQLEGQRPTIGPTKTRGSRRTVHLPAVAARALADHLDTFTGPGSRAYVFATPDGQLVSAAIRWRAFKAARIAAGCPNLRFHDLRHTGATLATLAGAGLRDVMRRLGHTTPRAALIYQHATDGADRRVAARLDALADAGGDPFGGAW